MIFIQKSKADDFKKLAQKENDDFKVTVTDAFVYGQKKGGSNRFLVYHDTTRDIFQVCSHFHEKSRLSLFADHTKHRFIQGMIAKIGDTVAEMVNKLGYTDIKLVSGALEGTFGDPLKKY